MLASRLRTHSGRGVCELGVGRSGNGRAERSAYFVPNRGVEAEVDGPVVMVAGVKRAAADVAQHGMRSPFGRKRIDAQMPDKAKGDIER